jgi:hypothetical protein
VYDKIDVVYYFKESRLEYDITVKAGARISDIKMRFRGADALSISDKGELVFKSGMGSFVERIPESYQIIDGKKVQRVVKYSMLENDLIGFTCDNYDANVPLIIDPVLIFSTFIGGSGSDNYNMDMQVDNAGNTYLCGQVTSSNFPTTPGSFDLTYNGGSTDGVVMKLSNNGNSMIYCTYLGSYGFDGVNAIWVDKTSGEVTLCGFTEGPTFPVTPGAIQSTVNGSRDNVVAKLNAAGSALIFSTLLGGPADDRVFDLTLDNLGNIYVIGYGGSNMPVSPGCFQSTYFGNYDVYTYKLNPTATAVLYCTYIGGTTYDRPGSIAVDAQHNVYISGTVDGFSGGFPVTSGAYDISFNGGVDIFVAKFDSTLSNLLYSTFVGGPGVDWTLAPSSLKLNAANEAIGVGYVDLGFPTTAGCYDNSFNGGVSDGALFKISANGSSLLYGTFMGSSGDDRTWALQLDAAGNYWCAGQCGSGTYPTTACAYDNTYNGGISDGFISEFSASGSQLLYSTFIGGTSNDEVYALEVNGSTLQVAGTTGSTDYPVTTGAYDISHNGGGNDYFVTRLLGNTIPIFITGPSVICSAQSATLTASGATSYSWSGGPGTATMVVNPLVTTVYTVTGFTSSGCTGTETFVVTISGSAPSGLSPVSGPTLVCLGSAMQYSVNPLPGVTSYSWTLPNGWTGSSSTTVITVSGSPGSGSVSVVAINNCGPSVPSVLAVNVSTIALNIIAGTPSVCSGSPVQLSATGASSFMWNTGSASSSIVVSPTTNTMYIVSGTNAACTASQSISISVYPLPQLVVNGLKKTICRNEKATITVSGANTYLWNTGATQVTITPQVAATSTYVVTGTDANGCTNTATYVQQVAPCTGLEKNEEAEFFLYPNPANSILNVVCEDSRVFLSEIQIIGIDGKIIRSDIIMSRETTIDLSEFCKGMYLIQVKKDGKLLYSEKIIRQ